MVYISLVYPCLWMFSYVELPEALTILSFFLFMRWNGLHWVPSGVISAMAGLVMFDCQGYVITPKMKTRGTAERRLLSLGHSGLDCDDLGHRKIEFLPSGFGAEQTFWGMDIHR